MQKISVKMLVLCALFAALIAVCTQIQLPIGPVPITLSLLPVLLSAALLDKRCAALSSLVYLLMGLVGLPVFTGLTGGPGKLFGVTGGYIIGYVLCAFSAAWMMEKWGRAWWKQALSMAVGVLVCYAFGTAWFMATKGTGLWTSLTLCVFPFLPGDALKIAVAVLLSKRLEAPMRRALSA